MYNLWHIQNMLKWRTKYEEAKKRLEDLKKH